MRSPKSLLVIFAILLASCATGSDGPTSDSSTEDEAKPAAVPDVTGQRIRVEWRNLNPRHGENRFGLVNRSSPEAARLVSTSALKLKPAEDEDMATLLLAFDKSDFYDHATPNLDADSLEMGDGHGVVSLVKGEKKWALVFRPTGGVKSDIPKTYLDLKLLIMIVYNRTFSLQISTPQEGFQQPTHKRR